MEGEYVRPVTSRCDARHFSCLRPHSHREVNHKARAIAASPLAVGSGRLLVAFKPAARLQQLALIQ